MRNYSRKYPFLKDAKDGGSFARTTAVRWSSRRVGRPDAQSATADAEKQNETEGSNASFTQQSQTSPQTSNLGTGAATAAPASAEPATSSSSSSAATAASGVAHDHVPRSATFNVSSSATRGAASVAVCLGNCPSATSNIFNYGSPCAATPLATAGFMSSHPTCRGPTCLVCIPRRQLHHHCPSLSLYCSGTVLPGPYVKPLNKYKTPRCPSDSTELARKSLAHWEEGKMIGLPRLSLPRRPVSFFSCKWFSYYAPNNGTSFLRHSDLV